MSKVSTTVPGPRRRRLQRSLNVNSVKFLVALIRLEIRFCTLLKAIS